MRKKKINIFYLIFGIITIVFISCNHRNFGISEIGIRMLILISIGIIDLIIQKPKMNKLSYIFLFLFINIIIIAILNYDLPYFNQGYFMTYSIYILLCFLTITIKSDRLDVNYLINTYIISSMIISMFMIIFPETYLSRGSTKFLNGPIFEVNYLSFYLTIGLGAIYYKIMKQKKENKKTKILIICTFINIYTNCLTGSRMGVLGIILLTFFFFIEYNTIKKISAKTILLYLLGIVVLFIFMQYIFSLLPNNIKDRIFVDEIIDESNISRIEHWKNAMQAIRLKPFLGYGIITSANAIHSATNMYMAAHNTILSMWLNLGFIFTATIFSIIAYSIYYFFNAKEYVLMGISIVLMISSFIVEFDIHYSFWIALIIILKMINLMTKEQNKITNKGCKIYEKSTESII